MSVSKVNQGVQAIQAGQHQQGAQLIQAALQDEALNPQIRAVALMWLAETDTDVAFKIDCYQRAQQADPNNQDVAQRLAYWQQQQPPAPPPPQQQDDAASPSQGIPPVSEQKPPAPKNPLQENQATQAPNPPQADSQKSQATQQPPPPPETMPESNKAQPPASAPEVHYLHGQKSPYSPQSQQPPTLPEERPQPQAGQQPARRESTGTLSQAVTVVGIRGGPNGDGSGFFVAEDGIIATTRFLVGGAEMIRVVIPDAGEFNGRVVRSYPHVDLAFIKVDAQVPSLVRQTSMGYIPDGEALIAAVYPEGGINGNKRQTRQAMAEYWFATTIDRLHDAGGNPVFDSTRNLVGMLTANASRATYHMYGLHISLINHLLGEYRQTMQELGTRHHAYCPNCGIISMAPSANAPYCEHCGATMPYAEESARYPQPQLASFYGETRNMPCPNCQSTVGTDDGICLRCGFDTQAPEQAY